MPTVWRSEDEAIAALLDAARRNEQSAPRKHHLIPASYLERWALRDRVRVTETMSKHTYTPRPSTAARETDFYSLASDDIDPEELPPLLLETILSRVEGRGKPRIDQLIASGPRSLDLEGAMDMANYLGFQMTRGRGFREQIASATNQMMQVVASRVSDTGIAGSLQQRGREATPDAIATTLEALDRWIAGDLLVRPHPVQSAALAAEMAVAHSFYLVGRAWRVYRSTMPLITCDDPVVALGGLRRDPRWQPGVATAAVIIFPLDRHHLLAMFHPGMDLEPMALLPELLPTEADQVNLALAANSDRWLFEAPNSRRTLTLCVPPWPSARSTTERINVVNDPEGEYHRNARPTRWQPPFRFPGWPVDRWWSAAEQRGLHDLQYDWRQLPRPMYDVLD